MSRAYVLQKQKVQKQVDPGGVVGAVIVVLLVVLVRKALQTAEHAEDADNAVVCLQDGPGQVVLPGGGQAVGVAGRGGRGGGGGYGATGFGLQDIFFSLFRLNMRDIWRDVVYA
jgi:hypothetical protein